ncbi:unnamed protein product [Brassica oleracea var. botrytis]
MRLTLLIRRILYNYVDAILSRNCEANILKLLELKAKAFELWENKVVGAQIFSDINHLFECVVLVRVALEFGSEKQMGNSLPLTLTLPELKYPIGSEPKEKNVSINQHSTSMYISIVERKTVYGILTRSIVTVKKNEAWFHFAGQPMKFSIREFHMVTGLKCNGEVEGPRGEYEWDLLKGRTHKLSDVLNQLKRQE